MSGQLMIDSDYAERVTLSSGECVSLRLIRPSDKAKMLRAFDELSDASRYKRFFGAKQKLTESDLRYFTENDYWDHFALGAVMLEKDGSEGEGLAVARCVRLHEDPECAEVAITVIDRIQGKGLGRALLERLITAALEREIYRFRFLCLAYNQEMQNLVKQVCQVVETHSDGDLIVAETELPRDVPERTIPSAPERMFNFYRLFRAMAIHSVDLQLCLGRTVVKRSVDSGLVGADLLRRIKYPGSSKKKHSEQQ
jgi:GNAT superfamily N-acetyltransferase